MRPHIPLTALSAGATVAIVAAAAPAAAAPTLSFDSECYLEGQPMHVSGSGYTPSGDVLMRFSRVADQLDSVGTLETTADAFGAFSLYVGAPLLAEASDRDRVAVAAEDTVKVAAGGGPPDAVAAALFQVTELDVDVRRWDGKPPNRRKNVTVRATGFTLDLGNTLYAHYVRKRRAVKRTRVGTLAGPCGDLRATIRQFPAGLKPGRYTVAFSTSRRWSPRVFSVDYRVFKPARARR
jgi:hypothetical protein